MDVESRSFVAVKGTRARVLLGIWLVFDKNISREKTPSV